MDNNQQTAMQELIEWLHDEDNIPDSFEVIKKATELLPKEQQQIEQAVNNTIDAYHYYVESPHNQPPMNGQDYFKQTYQNNK